MFRTRHFFVLTLALGLCACGGEVETDLDASAFDGGRTVDDGGGSPAEHCRVDEECSDGLFCTGLEVCAPADERADARGCIPGQPRDCSDGLDCTLDDCSETLRTCVHSAPDNDGDGHGDAACRTEDGSAFGDDCDDADANRYPGNTEVCNGGDEDCNPDTIGFLDEDGDGAASIACCNPTVDGGTLCGPDCDDADSTIRPGIADGPMMNCDSVDNDCSGVADEGCPCVSGISRACGSEQSISMIGLCAPGEQFCISGDWADACTGDVGVAMEFCDGADNDCDGEVDEAVLTTYFRDADGDGFGGPDETAQACSPPVGFTILSNDCNDSDPNIKPTAPELCDTIDNNCQAGTDEGCACVDGETRNCGPDDEVGECAFGSQRCVGGAWGTCNGAVNTAPESCNGRDDDCDGTIDDGVTHTYYLDSDRDGFGDVSSTTEGCAVPAGYSSNASDCDDGRGAVNPAATEVCDGRDNDCDTDVDPGCACTDGATQACGSSDGSGGIETTGSCAAGTQRCIDGAWAECVGAVTPSPESCNGLDDDCDGSVDDGVLNTYYRDVDGDGFGNALSSQTACNRSAGYVTLSTDCNDASGGGAINPAATEVCDGVDNNCDTDVDPGCACSNGATRSCGAPNGSGGIETDGQCQAGTQRCIEGSWAECVGAIVPATESCNGLDDDCDGSVDDGVLNTYYRDVDGDGFGNASSSQTSCSPSTGYVTLSTDCNDASGGGAINPAATEVCDGVDNNCDTDVDPGCACSNGMTRGCGAPNGSGGIETDGQCQAGTQRCIDGAWAECVGAVEPTPESCNGLDDDCDGSVDDGVGNTYYRDVDGDGFGTPSTTQTACSPSTGYVFLSTDCRDNDGAINPAAFEACDTIDNNCDGTTDPGCVCTDGATRDCGPGSDVGACVFGTQLCLGGQWGDCAGAVFTQGEACNGVDDDCDGSIDDGFACRVGQSATCVTECGRLTGGSQLCLSDCSGFSGCRASEVCNGCDDDLDGAVDDGFDCAQGQLVPCTNRCGVDTTVVCDGSCAVPTCNTPGEYCNYCDDDGNADTTDQSLATGTISGIPTCSQLIRAGSASCPVVSGSAVAMLSGGSGQSAAAWAAPTYLGWGPITVHAQTDVSRGGTTYPADGWAIVLSDAPGLDIGAIGGNVGVPTTREGLSIEWHFFSGASISSQVDQLVIRRLRGSSSPQVMARVSIPTNRLDSTTSGTITQDLFITYTPNDPQTIGSEELLEVRQTATGTPLARLIPSPDGFSRISQVDEELTPGGYLDVGMTAASGGSTSNIRWNLSSFLAGPLQSEIRRTNVCF